MKQVLGYVLGFQRQDTIPTLKVGLLETAIYPSIYNAMGKLP